MIGIFSWTEPHPNTVPPGWHPVPDFSALLNFDQSTVQYQDIDQYCNVYHDIKVAFYCVEYGYAAEQQLEIIERLAKASNIVFVFHSEVYEYGFIDSQVELFENVYWIIPGDNTQSKQKIITWQYHLWRIDKLYQEQLNYRLQELTPYEPKKYYFSALLGGPKKHRIFINHQTVIQHLQDKIICKMLPTFSASNPVSLDVSPNWWMEPDIEIIPDQPFSGGGHHCRYHGLVVATACIVPITVYNTCAYSILAETGYTNYCHMPTEKTAKLFLGQQLFVAFSGAGYLQHLRNSGFRTFENIIDESYDQIEDDHTRWQQAVDQVIDLCNRNQLEVLEQAKPILQHNFDCINKIGLATVLNDIQQALSKKEINCTIQNLIINPYPESQ